MDLNHRPASPTPQLPAFRCDYLKLLCHLSYRRDRQFTLAKRMRQAYTLSTQEGQMKNGTTTTPKQFRLSPDTIADLERIKKWLADNGHGATRSDAVRYAAREIAKKISKSVLTT